MNAENFIVRKAEESDYQDILKFIDEDFMHRERLAIVSGLVSQSTLGNNKDENAHEPDERFISWLSDKVSLIAVDKKDQTLAGIAVNFIAKREDHDQEKTSSVKIPLALSAVLKFIEKLEDGHNMFVELDTDQGMDLRFLGVKEKYSGKGIARKLTVASIEIAKSLNLKFIQSIPTSKATLHLFEDLGFETRSEMKCQDFYLNDGSTGFPYATPSDVSRFVVKIL